MMRRWEAGANDAADGDDSVCDFDLDYVTHTIKIQIGNQQAGTDIADTMRFSEDVNFQDFYDTDDAMSNLKTSLSFLVAGLIAIAF